MDKPSSTMAQQIARAVSTFGRQRTGYMSRSVTLVLSKNTLVITPDGALSPAEEALIQNPAGAVLLQEYHRELFANAYGRLRQGRSTPGWPTVT